MLAELVERALTRNGRAVGVRTSDGTECAAKDAVIGAIHPHLLGTMVPEVDPAIADAAKRTEISANVCFTVHAALNEPLRFKAGGHVNRAYFTELMPNRLDDLRGFFDSLRRNDSELAHYRARSQPQLSPRRAASRQRHAAYLGLRAVCSP